MASSDLRAEVHGLGALLSRKTTAGPIRDYTASTITTPGTALIAPAICGETLKRPGSFTSTSVPSASMSTSATSPSAFSCAARPGASPFEPLGHAVDRRLAAQKHAQPLGELGGRLIERLGILDAGAHVVALQLGRQRQQHRAARLQEVAELLQAFREHHRLEMPGRVREPDDAHLAAGAGAPLHTRNDRPGDAAGARARADRARELGIGLHAQALERGGVVVERMAGEEEADGVEFLLQPLGRGPRLDVRQPDRLARGRSAEGELQRAALGRLVLALRHRQHAVDRREHARAVAFERVERARRGEALQHALVDGARIDAAGEVRKVGERLVAARLDDRLDRLAADAFERRERVVDGVARRRRTRRPSG